LDLLVAFVVGFAVGEQGGSRERHDVVGSFDAIRSSEELAALVMVARSQVGHALRGVANLVDGSDRETASPDLVDRVRQLIER
jgi:hypothetical protein